MYKVTIAMEPRDGETRNERLIVLTFEGKPGVELGETTLTVWEEKSSPVFMASRYNVDYVRIEEVTA